MYLKFNRLQGLFVPVSFLNTQIHYSLSCLYTLNPYLILVIQVSQYFSMTVTLSPTSKHAICVAIFEHITQNLLFSWADQ